MIQAFGQEKVMCGSVKLKVVALGCCLAIVPPCGSTTIVTIVTRHAIVVCADGKVTESSNKPTAPRPMPPQQKTFVIQDRFVVSHAGVKSFDVQVRRKGKTIAVVNVPYSLERVIGTLRRKVSLISTTLEVADFVKTELDADFKDFDAILRSGQFTREMLPSSGAVVTSFSIAGYDGAIAHVYEAGVEIDWNTLSHRIPPVKPLYPDRRRNLSLFIEGGGEDIFARLTTGNSVSARFAQDMPTEYAALRSDSDLDIAHMVTLARGLVGVEIAANPNIVGYPLTVTVIQPNEKPATQTYTH